MFDSIAPSEMMLVLIVALAVIGPKDLPKAMRFVGHWVGKARGMDAKLALITKICTGVFVAMSIVMMLIG